MPAAIALILLYIIPLSDDYPNKVLTHCLSCSIVHIGNTCYGKGDSSSIIVFVIRINIVITNINIVIINITNHIHMNIFYMVMQLIVQIMKGYLLLSQCEPLTSRRILSMVHKCAAEHRNWKHRSEHCKHRQRLRRLEKRFAITFQYQGGCDRTLAMVKISLSG